MKNVYTLPAAKNQTAASRKTFTSVSKLILALILLVGMPGVSWGEGTENFTNLPTSSSSSYLSRSWTGTDGVTWTATAARTDQTINGKAICWNGNNGNVVSPTYAGGMGTLTFNYVRAFTGTSARTLQVWVNGSQIGSNITVSPTSDVVVQYSNTINISGNVVLEIRCPSGAQVKVDDITWTTYNGSSVPNLAISGTTAHGSVCPNTSASPITYTITNSGTVAAEGVTVISSDAQFVVSGLSSTTIAASGGTATYNVTFTPASAGAKTATITVASTTSGSNSPTSSLTGTGTTTVAQTITSSNASSLTAQGATLNGTVTNLGSCPTATERGFVYSVTATDATPRVGDPGVTKEIVAGMSTSAYNLAVTGLLSSTNYSFTSYVYNGTSYTYGTDRTFTTLAALVISGTTGHGLACPGFSAPPQTYTITNNGSITTEGISVVSGGTNASDFVVSGLSSTTINPGATATYQVTFTPASSGSKSATITVSSTTPGIANATSNLTGTGSTPATAEVITSAATSVAGTTTTLNGNVITLGVCPTTTEKGFVHSMTSENPDPIVGGFAVTKTSVAGLTSGIFNVGITGLLIGTGYSFKAYVFDGSNYTYGNVFTFTTTTPPSNDLCAGAIDIPCGESITINNALATDDVLPAISCGTTSANFKGIWFKVTPPASGAVTVSTCATSPLFDTYMRIYSGSCGSLTSCMGYDDDGCASGSLSELIFNATSNTTYYILITSYYNTDFGPITISATCPVSAPEATTATNINSSSFDANWNSVTGASEYRLDVGTTSSFTTGSPTTIISQGFNNSANNFSVSGGTYYSGNSSSGDRPASSSFVVEGTHSVGRSNGTAIFTSNAFDLSGYTLLELSFKVAAFSISSSGNGLDAGDIVTVEISPDNGTTYYSTVRVLGNTNAYWAYSATGVASVVYDANASPVDFQPAGGGSRTSDGYSTISVSGLPSSNNLKVKITIDNNDVSERWVIDDFKITGTPSSILMDYNNLTVNGLTQIVSGLSSGTNYYYRVRAVGSNTSPNSNVITVITPHGEKISASAGDWNSITWSPSGIPSATDNVTINHAVTLAGNADCNDLTIGSGSLTLASGASIITRGAVSGDVTVNRDLTGGVWHFISSPVTTATSNVFNGKYLQYFTESDSKYHDIIETNYSLSVSSGYAAWSAGAYSASFTGGSLNTGNYSNIALSKSGDGWNLVGNPYPSALDWSLVTGTNLEGAIYIENGGSWATWNGGTGIPNNDVKYISPCQGFFVQANGAGAVMNITNAMRTHTQNAFYKQSDEKVSDMVRLEVSGNGFQDQAIVRLRSEATAEYDGDWDAYKMFGDVTDYPQIYTLGSAPLAINAFRELAPVQVGIRVGLSGAYTIAATEINNLQNVKLEDTKTGIFTDLTSKSYTFDFTAGENEQRFKLHFTALDVEEKEAPKTTIYANQQTVYVIMDENSVGDIYIYNLAGQLLAAKESATGQVNMGLSAAGVYLVKVITPTETITRKVVIR